jgi:heme exporter protein B
VSPLAALFVRDLRLAIRVGGGAGIGVLFFLVVVVLTPFAIGPDQAFWPMPKTARSISS